jgi:hypothetical protein
LKKAIIKFVPDYFSWDKRRFALLFAACDLVMTFFGGIEYGMFDRSHRFECGK